MCIRQDSFTGERVRSMKIENRLTSYTNQIPRPRRGVYVLPAGSSEWRTTSRGGEGGGREEAAAVYNKFKKILSCSSTSSTPRWVDCLLVRMPKRPNSRISYRLTSTTVRCVCCSINRPSPQIGISFSSILFFSLFLRLQLFLIYLLPSAASSTPFRKVTLSFFFGASGVS